MIKKFALTAATVSALFALHAPASATYAISLTDSSSGTTASCDFANPGACTLGFTWVQNALGVSFIGTLGNWTVNFSSSTGNLPGNSSFALHSASTALVTFNGTSALLTGEVGGLTIVATGLSYNTPIGVDAVFSGSASLASQAFTGGDKVDSEFYYSTSNSSTPGSGALGCTINAAAGTGCDGGATASFPNPGPLFSMRTVQKFSLTEGSFATVNSQSKLTAVPEPATAALVGLALVGLGVASRRRRSA